jgi:hypothetical protein
MSLIIIHEKKTKEVNIEMNRHYRVGGCDNVIKNHVNLHKL